MAVTIHFSGRVPGGTHGAQGQPVGIMQLTTVPRVGEYVMAANQHYKVEAVIHFPVPAGGNPLPPRVFAYRDADNRPDWVP